MGRKGTLKYGKGEKSTSSEREGLLAEKEEENKRERSKNLSVPSAPPRKKSIERKKSIWAPVATATSFEDVPVFTICPYCSSKVVTKTQFKRGRKHWCYCCCCLPYFLDVFKDVIHVCPKCNTQIAIYNRFNFFKIKANQTPDQQSPITSQTTNQQAVPTIQTTNPQPALTIQTANQQPIPTIKTTNQISPTSVTPNQYQAMTSKPINQQLPTSKTKTSYLQCSQTSPLHYRSRYPRTTRSPATTSSVSSTPEVNNNNRNMHNQNNNNNNNNSNNNNQHHNNTRSASWHHIYHDRR